MKNTDSGSGSFMAVLRVVTGNFLEMFDFFLFGFYATSISATFFPSENELGSLLKALMAFGAGFLMRPLGALFLGAYIDRVGRRRGLIVTLGLMAAGTLLIAAVPGYARIGLLAPCLVVAGRLIQGFSAGVELGGVSVYLAEIAKPGKKGFYVSWQSASQQMAIVVASLVGYLLHRALPTSEIDAWGWRIPFFVACLIIPMLFVLRKSMQETREFLARKKHPALREVVESIGRNWRLVLGGMLMTVTSTVSFYFITVYTPIFGRTVLRLDDASDLAVTACVGLSNFAWLPIMGAFSDRVGRRPLLLVFSFLILVTAYPALSWLTAAPSVGRLLAAELWLSFLYASYNAALVVALIEIMPVALRTTGFSLAYSLAVAIFGGFTPVVATSLVEFTHNRASPAYWLMAAAAGGLSAALMLRKRPPGADVSEV